MVDEAFGAFLVEEVVHAVSMQGFAIRTAEPGDVVALRDLYWRSSLSNDGDRASLLAHPDALDFDELSVLEGRTRVAIDGERVVGFATIRVHGVLAELEDLFVDPEWMRRGLGRRLVNDRARRLSHARAERERVRARRVNQECRTAVLRW